MSRYFSKRHESLIPYVPGEQPQNRRFLKLNTNESPYPVSEKAMEYVSTNLRPLQLYSDPECVIIRSGIAELYGLHPDQIIAGNGSDEILNFLFMAFCDEERPAVFPDITYGFYPVFAQLNHIPYTEIPLQDDFSICISDYIGINKNIFIANPNAPTGMVISLEDIKTIALSNPHNIVVIDEAYVDFGAESAVGLVNECDNLVVVQTFSKSRSMAGARLGFAVGSRELIADMNTLRYSTNPYNVNSYSMILGAGVLTDEDYTRSNCNETIRTREYTVRELEKLGFTVLDSKANFIFAASDEIEGGVLYERLKDEGVLVRHFTKPRISNYNRITIGTMEQMDELLSKIKMIIGR